MRSANNQSVAEQKKKTMVLRYLKHPRLGMADLMKEISALLGVLRREPKIKRGEFDLNSLPALLGKVDPVILDIGCNDGSHTLKFLSLFDKATVYSFEPDPRAQERFKNKVTDERAPLFEVALAAVDGTADFYVSTG